MFALLVLEKVAMVPHCVGLQLAMAPYWIALALTLQLQFNANSRVFKFFSSDHYFILYVSACLLTPKSQSLVMIVIVRGRTSQQYSLMVVKILIVIRTGQVNYINVVLFYIFYSFTINIIPWLFWLWKTRDQTDQLL